MDTRSKGNKAPSQGTEPTTEQLEAHFKQLNAREAEIANTERALKEAEGRLKAQEAMLHQQSIQIEASKRKLMQEHEQVAQQSQALAARENEILARNRHTDKREIEHSETVTAELASVSRDFSGAAHLGYNPLPPSGGGDDFPPPKVSFREATESVPYFDGYNIPLQQFTRACRRAREIVPPSAERNLTKLLITKLRARAYYAVEDEPCDTVIQLIDLLTGAFGSPKTIDQYRGELSTIYLRAHEHIIDYISRVKDLRTSILDEERRAKGHLDSRFVSEIDGLTARSFCEGLPLEYRLQLKSEARQSHTEAFAAAKIIAKRQELDKQRYEPRQRENRAREYQRPEPRYRENRDRGPLRYETQYSENRDREYRRANPIGGPLAYPAPQRSGGYAYRGNNSPSQNSPRGSQTPPPNAYRGDFPKTNGYRNEHSPPANINRSNSNLNPHSPLEARREIGNDKYCRYCKRPGHDIEECRRRDYYNNIRKTEPGNASNPSGYPDAARTDETRRTRPVNPINVEEADEAASQC